LPISCRQGLHDRGRERLLKQPQVLLVGRNRDLLRMLSTVLASRGASIAFAADADEAVCSIRRTCADVVIYDRGRNDPELDAARAGFKGRLLVLTDEPLTQLRLANGSTIIRKPVSLEVLVEKALG
jgi:DNA-binding response OmpR family regulator